MQPARPDVVHLSVESAVGRPTRHRLFTPSLPSVPISRGFEGLSRAAPDASWRKRCATGFLTNVTNPKGIVFMVAVMTVTMCAIDALIMHAYAYGANAFGRVFKQPRAVRIQNRVFGTLLMAAVRNHFRAPRGACMTQA